jgi:hypothetical protein
MFSSASTPLSLLPAARARIKLALKASPGGTVRDFDRRVSSESFQGDALPSTSAKRGFSPALTCRAASRMGTTDRQLIPPARAYARQGSGDILSANVIDTKQTLLWAIRALASSF